MTGSDLAATMVATFIDEWVRAGVTDVVIAPGSRSTPLTVGVLSDGRLRCHVHLDERSAAFTALGLGLASGRPAPVITTSGTAAVHLHPAVVEAHHAAVPMIACTADRPPELQGIGAPQTIRQPGLYGASVRAAIDLEPPTTSTVGTWRSWAAQTVLASTGRPPGPVHLNLAFREPLLGIAGPVPAGRAGDAPWHRPVAEDPPDLHTIETLAAEANTGVVVAGRGCGGDRRILDLGDHLGWPVLADPLSGVRTESSRSIASFDALLRSSAFSSAVPEGLVLRFGASPASKVLQQWTQDPARTVVVVDGGPELPEVPRDAAVTVSAEPGPVAGRLLALPGRDAGRDRDRWTAADRIAQSVLDDAADGPLTEPMTARIVTRSVPPGSTLIVSSSMPVRDVEWYGVHRADVRTVANRGANGIDGVVSTSVGVALSGRQTVCLLGDLAFLHDVNGLLGAADRGIDLTMVVVDNDGGGIFSFLPQAAVLDAAMFERAFGTPHGLDLVAVAEAHGVPARRVRTTDDLRAEMASPSGVRVLVVPSDRAANVEAHDDLHQRIDRAVAVSLRGG